MTFRAYATTWLHRAELLRSIATPLAAIAMPKCWHPVRPKILITKIYHYSPSTPTPATTATSPSPWTTRTTSSYPASITSGNRYTSRRSPAQRPSSMSAPGHRASTWRWWLRMGSQWEGVSLWCGSISNSIRPIGDGGLF